MDEVSVTVIESRNPATGELLGVVDVTTRDGVADACKRAADAQRTWAGVPVRERAAIVGRAADYLRHNARRYAELVTKENGKSLGDAMLADVANSVIQLRWIERHAPRVLADERLAPGVLFLHRRHRLRFEPLGVVAVIAPWNYPLAIPAGDVGAALVAGNAVLLKPSPLTPLTGAALTEAFHAAGVGTDILALIQGDADQGDALCVDPHVAKVVFTGSTAVGRVVARTCAEHGKAYTLELGGKDPAIVREDADLDHAITGIVWAGCSTAGQTCAAVERVYVHESRYEEFVQRLVARVGELVVADPSTRDDVAVGPMIDARQWQRVKDLVDDATSHGARVEAGATFARDGGHYVAPTVLTGVDHSMRLMREENFGPVLPVMAFRSDEDAIRLANDSNYGLGASIWTRDRRAAERIADQLECTMVWVNEHAYSHGAPVTPWGGRKDSGSGVVHGKLGLYGMTAPKLVSTERLRFLFGGLWGDPRGAEAVEGFLAVVFERSALARLGALSRHGAQVGHFLRATTGVGRGARRREGGRRV